MVLLRLMKLAVDKNILLQVHLYLFEARTLSANFSVGSVLPTVRVITVQTDARRGIGSEMMNGVKKLEIHLSDSGVISYLFSAGHFLQIERPTTGVTCHEF